MMEDKQVMHGLKLAIYIVLSNVIGRQLEPGEQHITILRALESLGLAALEAEHSYLSVTQGGKITKARFRHPNNVGEVEVLIFQAYKYVNRMFVPDLSVSPHIDFHVTSELRGLNEIEITGELLV